MNCARTRSGGRGLVSSSTLIKDPAPPEEQVKLWMWLPGLVAVLLMTCYVLRVHFDMPIAETLLSLLLSFFFSFLAVQSTGQTSKNHKHFARTLLTRQASHQ
jgi:hypothetical protein